jgi:hypothetical protein
MKMDIPIRPAKYHFAYWLLGQGALKELVHLCISQRYGFKALPFIFFPMPLMWLG